MKNKFIRNTLILSVVGIVAIAAPTLLTFFGVMDAYSSGVFIFLIFLVDTLFDLL